MLPCQNDHHSSIGGAILTVFFFLVKSQLLRICIYSSVWQIGNGVYQNINVIVNLNCRYASRDCGFPVVEEELAVFDTGPTMDSCGDPQIQEYLEQVMVDNGCQQPNTWTEAVQLYIKLKECAGL